MKRLIVALTIALLAGCSSTTSFRGNTPADYNEVVGRLHITLLQAPAWTPGPEHHVVGRELDALVARTFGQGGNFDDIYYVAVPRPVLDWAWRQTDSIRDELGEQGLAYLIHRYGSLPQTNFPYPDSGDEDDCDDAAKRTAAAVKLLITRRYGLRGATPYIPLLYTAQQHSFGGIPGSTDSMTGHVLCAELVYTAAGPTLDVREPQTGRRTPAFNWPNQALRIQD